MLTLQMLKTVFHAGTQQGSCSLRHWVFTKALTNQRFHHLGGHHSPAMMDWASRSDQQHHHHSAGCCHFSMFAKGWWSVPGVICCLSCSAERWDSMNTRVLLVLGKALRLSSWDTQLGLPANNQKHWRYTTPIFLPLTSILLQLSISKEMVGASWL